MHMQRLQFGRSMRLERLRRGDYCSCCALSPYIICVWNQVRYHEQGDVMVFDDSKSHFAFNMTSKPRVVLIVDIKRPENLPLGTATGGHTAELDDLIAMFK